MRFVYRHSLYAFTVCALLLTFAARVSAASTFTVGGTVSGLTTGQSVTLLDNGGNSTVVSSNTTFTFSTALASGAAYKVTVGTLPTGDTCTVTNGSGTIASANVTNVAVACKHVYSIGGAVTGLTTGKSVTLLDNGGNSTVVSSNTTFTFTTKLATGAAYKVTVGTAPAGESCTVTNGSGTVASANITNVAVACKPVYSIGGAVTGLTTGKSVTLLDNGGNSTVVSSNTTFTFTTKLATGAAYKVTVGTAPAGESCTVTNGSGTVASANITNVAVACKPVYSIGGAVTGLTTGQTVTLLDNGGNSTVVSSNTTFTFSIKLATGAAYKVTVGTAPAGDACTVTNGTGTVASANITNVAVACKPVYSIGGAVTGLTTGQTVTLLDNGGNSTVVSSNTTFTFSIKLATGAAYKVTVGTAPAGDACTVTNGSGTVASANITNVAVACKPVYSIGGAVTGLTTGQTVTLLDNGGNSTVVSSNTTFTFSIKLATGAAYKVTVGTPPTGDTCTVTNGSGTVASANITNVAVACKPTSGTTYSIGGSVSGLTASQSVTLLDNGGNSTVVSSNTTFTFSTKLASGATYSVTVGTPPSGDTCSVTNGTGTVASANITNVAVACTTSSGGGGGGGPWWIPFNAAAITGDATVGKVGLYVVPSDNLESSPAPTQITTLPTTVLGEGVTYTITNNVLTSYSPVLMSFYDTAADGTTQIYGMTIDDTSTTPKPAPIGKAIPATQQICEKDTGYTDATVVTSGFAILQMGPSGATGCNSGPFTYELAHYTDSASTPQTVITTIDSLPVAKLYQNNLLAGILVFDSTTGKLNYYTSLAFTSPKTLLTGVEFDEPLATAVLKDSTPYGDGVLYLSVTFAPVGGNPSVVALYRIDATSGGTATLVHTGQVGASVTTDATNLYFEDVTSATQTLIYTVPIAGGSSPKLLYTGPIGSSTPAGYQFIGSNGSILAFDYYERDTSNPSNLTATKSWIYTISTTTPSTTPTTIGGPYTGTVGGFLASPSAGDASGDVLFANIIYANTTITKSGETTTFTYSSLAGSPGATLTATPLANSYYSSLGLLTGQANNTVLQVRGITATSGGFGGGNFYQVNVGTLAATEFTTTGGAVYKIPAGYFGELIGALSNNVAIGILLPYGTSPTGAMPEMGAAADLEKNFVLPISIANTNVTDF